MLASKARWNTGSADEALAAKLAGELGLDLLVAKLLVLRNIRSADEAKLFLFGGKEHAHDPFLLDGMQPAVERIRQALERGERIRIYGDYDADGVSSTSLMAHLLRGLGATFDTYIPHRIHEGYGLNRGAVDKAKEQGVGLIITVDTGISAVDEVQYIQELGMDVIVTDHHEPPDVLPDALSVINPKKPGCPYPFKQLAGVGVALKLAHALLGRLPEELLELAAIGTVADLMPLTGENRLIVKLGLERMQASSYPGIRALLGAAGIERKEITAGHIGYSLAPRINASGRLECADDAVRLLTTESVEEAERIASELDALNQERQRLVEEMTKEAVELADIQLAGGLDKVLVVAKEGWNPGVIGIVASKLVDKYYRPSIVLSIDAQTGAAKGSARSISGFDLYQALIECKEWLEHYGGHQAAAGMSLNREHIAAFAARLNRIADQRLTEEDLVPMLKADIACCLSEVPISSIEQLEKLAPFGMGNPAPKFVLSDLTLNDMRTMGKEHQHLKLVLAQTQAETAVTVEAVGFGRGALSGLIAPAARLDVLGELSINEWNGVRKPQLVMQDLRIAHFQLFDWRGASRLDKKLAALEQSLAAANGDGAALAVVLFDQAEAAAYAAAAPAELLRLPCWTAQPSGKLEPGNAAAGQLNIADMQDIMLYSAPRSIAQFREVLRQTAGLARCYAVFAELGADSSGALPSRDMFKLAYGALQQQGGWDLQNKALMQSFSKRSGLSPAMVEFVFQVFEELGFIERSGWRYALNRAPAKKDLTVSSLYQRRVHQQEVEAMTLYSSAKELEQWIVEQRKSGNFILEEIV